MKKKAKSFTKQNLFIIAPILIALEAVIYIYCPHVFKLFFYVNDIALALALLLIFTKLGSTKLAANDNNDSGKKLSLGNWLGNIAWIQLSLFLLFFGLAQFVSVNLPIATQAHPHSAQQILSAATLHYGLFPWGTIALVTVGLAYFAYRKNKDAYVSDAANSIVRCTPNTFIGAFINSSTRIFTFFVLSLTAAMVIMITVSLIANPHALFMITGLKPNTVFASFFLMLVVFSKKLNARMATILQKTNPFVTMLIVMAFLTILLLVFSLFLNTHKVTHMQQPAVIKAILHKGWQLHWQLFALSWWFAWVPLASTFIARVSRGYSIRSTVLASLALPAILTGIVLFHHHAHTSLIIPMPFSKAMAIAGFLSLLFIIGRANNFPMVIRGYLSKTEKVKFRPPFKYVQRWVFFTAFMIYLFLPMGIYSTLFILLYPLIAFSLSLLVSCVGLIKAVSPRVSERELAH